MGRHAKLTEKQYRKVIVRYLKGESVAHLAGEHKVTKETIYRRFREDKIPLRFPHPPGAHAENGRRCHEPNPAITIDRLLTRSVK